MILGPDARFRSRHRCGSLTVGVVIPCPILTAPADPTRVSMRFIAVLALAHVGAFTAFVPLLSLLVPLQAARLMPQDSIGLLSLVTLCGAGVASVSNLGAGWMSDRTVSRFGRRRPWIALGLLGVLIAYGLIATATSAATLIGAVMLFQLAFNLMFGPLVAILADRVPDAQKGWVAAFLGLAPPLGALSGVLITSTAFDGTFFRYLVLGGLVAAGLLPLLLTWRESPAAAAPGQAKARRLPLTRDFLLCWASRFCLQISASVVNAYMLFYLIGFTRFETRFPDVSVESGLAALIAMSTGLALASGFIGGLASDRSSRRKPFIGTAAALMAIGLGVFALWPTWPGPLVGYALYGLGFGLYTTVDAALVAQVLPSRRDAARDLGVMNLTNTLPAVLAPLLVLAALGPSREAWDVLMTIAAAMAAFGGTIVLFIRTVR